MYHCSKSRSCSKVIGPSNPQRHHAVADPQYASAGGYDIPMQDDARMTVIEEKLSHLEKYVGDLDEVLRDLSKRMDVHAKGVTAVRKLLEDHLSDADDPGDEKPPHW